MGPSIHPTAVIDPKATIGRDVTIGPCSVVGPEVRIGDGVRIGAHVVIEGRTSVGEGTEALPFSMLGAPPGHLKDKGEGTELVIGARVSIREHVSLHRGSNEGSGRTVIGDECAFFAHAHVGHDCVLKEGVLLINGAMLGGHVHVGAHAMFGGNSGAHQFCRVGTRAFIAGGTDTRLDVPPYCMFGKRGRLAGLNSVGLRRSGMAKETIQALREAYRIFFRSSVPRKEAIEKVRAQYAGIAEVEHFVEFIEESKRGVAGQGDEEEC